MPEFILGARGHDFGRHDPETLFSSIGQAGFACTQLAFTKAVEGVKSYADVTPALVERARAAAAASGVGIAVDGTYVELSYADEDKRRAEVAKVLSQIPVAKALGAGCMGSETTNMAKQPGVTRKEAQEALLRSLGEILPACEEQGVLFAVECVYYHAMNTPEAVRMVLDTMASPNLRVICDFANYVGPEAASVDAQRRIWDKVGSWYGDKITAVHFKGQNFQPDGTLYSTSLEDSCVDYAGGFTLLKRSSREGTPDLNLLFQYNMPVRALAQMTGGMVGQETVDGIVMEAKGFWIIGLLRALIGFGQNAVSNQKFRAALDAERGGPAV